jgi:pSer/pThr/pTyr-binding forkhead associated (FHA) protein
LTGRNVSRHARLVRNEHGFRIEDLDSYNGVVVNGSPSTRPSTCAMAIG